MPFTVAETLPVLLAPAVNELEPEFRFAFQSKHRAARFTVMGCILLRVSLLLLGYDGEMNAI